MFFLLVLIVFSIKEQKPYPHGNSQVIYYY